MPDGARRQPASDGRLAIPSDLSQSGEAARSKAISGRVQMVLPASNGGGEVSRPGREPGFAGQLRVRGTVDVPGDRIGRPSRLPFDRAGSGCLRLERWLAWSWESVLPGARDPIYPDAIAGREVESTRRLHAISGRAQVNLARAQRRRRDQYYSLGSEADLVTGACRPLVCFSCRLAGRPFAAVYTPQFSPKRSETGVRFRDDLLF